MSINGSSFQEELIEELRRDGDHKTADRILNEDAYDYGFSCGTASKKPPAVSLADAEKFIKAQYIDWEHCAQSARAIAMFLKGVEWTLSKST